MGLVLGKKKKDTRELNPYPPRKKPEDNYDERCR